MNNVDTEKFAAFCHVLLVYARRAGHDLELYKVKLQEKYALANKFFCDDIRKSAMFIIAGNEAHRLGFTGSDRTRFAIVATYVEFGLRENIWSTPTDALKFYCAQFDLENHNMYEAIDTFIARQIAIRVHDHTGKTIGF